MGFSELIWGVKASFRNYVEAVGGSINLSDGATRTADGCFVFTAIPGGDLAVAADGSATGAMGFQGTITFDAHGGMLKATLTDLRLEVGVDGFFLTAMEAPMNQGRCTIAKLGPVTHCPNDGITMDAAITLDGMYQLADNYPPGTTLDPLRLTPLKQD